MSLRFLEKSDGSKILQYRDLFSGPSDWKDVPMAKEKPYILDRLRMAHDNWKRFGHLPADGIMVGTEEYAELEAHAEEFSMFARKDRFQQHQWEGIIISKHPTKNNGIFFLREAK